MLIVCKLSNILILNVFVKKLLPIFPQIYLVSVPAVGVSVLLALYVMVTAFTFEVKSANILFSIG